MGKNAYRTTDSVPYGCTNDASNSTASNFRPNEMSWLHMVVGRSVYTRSYICANHFADTHPNDDADTTANKVPD